MKRYIKSDDNNSVDPFENFDSAYRHKLALRTDDPNVLEILSYDPVTIVRVCVARNPNTPLEILEELAKDTDDSVRSSVAQRVDIPKELAVKLSKDRLWGVRWRLAMHTSDVDILRKLSTDRSPAVRTSVANNPCTPTDIIENYALNDPYWEVQETAKRVLDIT